MFELTISNFKWFYTVKIRDWVMEKNIFYLEHIKSN